MEEMLEKMSRTTSSGKALLRPASLSSSWKNTCAGDRHLVIPCLRRSRHPASPTDPGGQPAPAVLATALGEITRGEWILATLQTGKPGVSRRWPREQGNSSICAFRGALGFPWLKHHKKGEGLSGKGNLGKPGRAAMYKAG